jgi:hypothetical protein
MSEIKSGPPIRNPHFLPDGTAGEELPPEHSRFGYWTSALNNLPTGYFVWVEDTDPRRYTRLTPFEVTTPTGIKIRNPA